MKTGDIRTDSAKLKGVKVCSILLIENELLINLAGHPRDGTYTMRLKGIIGFKDGGVIGKPLSRYDVEDMGSYRRIRFVRANGRISLRCEYLEGEVAAGFLGAERIPS